MSDKWRLICVLEERGMPQSSKAYEHNTSIMAYIYSQLQNMPQYDIENIYAGWRKKVTRSIM